MYSFWKTTGLFAANLVFTYILLVSMQSKFKLKPGYVHLFIIIAVILYTVIMSAILTSKYEPFFFEVSPGRKACLQNQVSLDPTRANNSTCCGKGTKGGIPARYIDYGLLLNEEDLSKDWIRDDLFHDCS